MQRRVPFASFLFVALAASACGDDGTIIPRNSADTPPASLPPVSAVIPRLPPGPHWGMITGFNPLDSERGQNASHLYVEAKKAGMSVGRIQIDWSELETAPGVYDAAALADAIGDPNLQDLTLFVTLSTLDSDGLTLPDHLLDNGRLRDGLTLASPIVTDSFTGLLDWLAIELDSRNVWGLSLGNEIDIPVEDGFVTSADAEAFFVQGLSRWNAANANIGVTVTFTVGALSNHADLVSALRDQSDILTVNFYCLEADITVNEQDRWQEELETVKEAAGDRDIFIQELGCPIGYVAPANSFIGARSLERQRAFFRFMGDAFATDPQLRAATVFQLYDWSPELTDSFIQPLRDAGEDLVANRLEEWLTTVGMVRWSDTAPRPAWEEFLAQNRILAQQRRRR